MVTVHRFLLSLSLASLFIISTCYARTEVEFDCERFTEDNKTEISRILTVCNVKVFNISDPDSHFLFKDAAKQEFTGVFIRDSKFSVFPKKILDAFAPQVISLEVSFSDMTTIEDYSFRNATQLLHLDFGFNKLTEITEFAFVGADNLIALDLNVNEIKAVSAKAFDYMPKLEYLVLASNQIETLDKEMFSKLVNLKTVYLNRNPFTFIEPQWFRHNEQLSYLNMESTENVLTEVELELGTKWMSKLDFYCLYGILNKLTLRNANNISDITVIDQLELSFCKFTKLSDLIIDDLIHVTNLKMSGNDLTSLEHDLEFLHHVTHLDLRANPIQEIPKNFFKKLENLEFLNLVQNPIKLSPNMFDDLEKLNKLNLRHIDFKAVDVEWFNGLSNLEELEFSLDNVTSFDYISLMNALPTLRTLNVRGSSGLECGFLKKMVEDLKGMGRVDVLKDAYEEYPEVDKRGNYFYGIRCDEQLKDRHGYSYSYLKGTYDFHR